MDAQGASLDSKEFPVGQGESGVGGRVMIVEDHTMLAEALAMGLSASGFESHIAGLGDTESVIGEAALHRPDLVLLDLDLGTADGLDLLPRLRALGASVLVITGCTEQQRLAAAVALGASGWVSKSEPFERLLEASELAVRARPLIPGPERDELLEVGRSWLDEIEELGSCLASLTEREREVLAALRNGKSAQEIADEMVVSLGTVRTHIRAILSKLGVSTQLAAVAKADHRLLKRSMHRRPTRPRCGGEPSLRVDAGRVG